VPVRPHTLSAHHLKKYPAVSNRARRLSAFRHAKRKMVRPERFELPTYCSGGNRSIHLSYGRLASVYMRGDRSINVGVRTGGDPTKAAISTSNHRSAP
jgi:hypothetical protein